MLDVLRTYTLKPKKTSLREVAMRLQVLIEACDDPRITPSWFSGQKDRVSRALIAMLGSVRDSQSPAIAQHFLFHFDACVSNLENEVAHIPAGPAARIAAILDNLQQLNQQVSAMVQAHHLPAMSAQSEAHRLLSRLRKEPPPQ